ncbi:hypothetical protein AHiyo1_21700 [Arthrobacter sp. Hiyo1]|nr:hypothetical protein AHiyo1_21700 [Arthrobacter sp. Hiyo1]
MVLATNGIADGSEGARRSRAEGIDAWNSPGGNAGNLGDSGIRDHCAATSCHRLPVLGYRSPNGFRFRRGVAFLLVHLALPFS